MNLNLKGELITILVQWSCEILQEKLKSFINFAKDKLKPFYESYRCIRYELFFPRITKKKYFPYQESEIKNRYIEQLLFKDIKDFDDFHNNIEKNQEAQDIVRMYVKEFGISSCSFKIFTHYI